jgi:hypothetical protein
MTGIGFGDCLRASGGAKVIHGPSGSEDSILLPGSGSRSREGIAGRLKQPGCFSHQVVELGVEELEGVEGVDGAGAGVGDEPSAWAGALASDLASGLVSEDADSEEESLLFEA